MNLLPQNFSSVVERQEFILKWYHLHARNLPWRMYQEPYETLVAETMSQQTQLSRVVTKWTERMQIFPTIHDLAAADTQTLLGCWVGLGYNSRALRLRACAQKVVSDYQGVIPHNLTDLLSLPGVGPYTASAVMAFSFNQEVGVIDTNITRILWHFFPETSERDKKQLQELAEKLVPNGGARIWYSALMDYAASELPMHKSKMRVNAKQSTFHGSRRQQRAKIVKYLTKYGSSNIEVLKGLIDDNYDIADILKTLDFDGFIIINNEEVKLK